MKHRLSCCFSRTTIWNSMHQLQQTHSLKWRGRLYQTSEKKGYNMGSMSLAGTFLLPTGELVGSILSQTGSAKRDPLFKGDETGELSSHEPSEENCSSWLCSNNVALYWNVKRLTKAESVNKTKWVGRMVVEREREKEVSPLQLLTAVPQRAQNGSSLCSVHPSSERCLSLGGAHSCSGAETTPLLRDTKKWIKIVFHHCLYAVRCALVGECGHSWLW